MLGIKPDVINCMKILNDYLKSYEIKENIIIN